jgi:hypothetical protein
VDTLELRLLPSVPFPDYSGPVNVASVPGGLVAYGAGDGGGGRVVVVEDGRTVFDQVVFEDRFRGGARVGLADLDGDGRFDLWVGAGPGGGPRVRLFANTGGGFAAAADFFAFDPDFRGGAFVEGWGAHLGIFPGAGGGPVGVVDGVARFYGSPESRDTIGWALEDADSDGVPEVFREAGPAWLGYDLAGAARGPEAPLLRGEYVPTPLLAAAPYPDRPGNTARVNAALAEVPAWLQRYLADTGMKVLVHSAGSITELPAFADLRGVPTPTAGDGDRTYDEVAAVGPTDLRTPAVVGQGCSDRLTLHEVGHGVWLRLTPAARAEWAAVHAGAGWADPYEALNVTESFTASFYRWVAHPGSNPAAAAAFFADLPARLIPPPDQPQ